MSLRRLLPLLLAGAVGLSGGGTEPGSARAETAPKTENVAVQTDMDGAFDLARRALAAQRPELAASIARQIIAARPKDPGGHLLLAAALTRAGRADAAVPRANAGFRLAQDRDTRFEAAYLTAEAMAGAGRDLGAKFWLRRADLYAASPAQRAVLARAYGTVARRSPFSFSISVFGGPSENVNGGSLHDYFDFYGIPIPIAKALPGQVWGGAVQLNYRLGRASAVHLLWAHRGVVLGGRARDIDPYARASDYRQDHLGISLSHVWRDPANRFSIEGRSSIARRWKGGQIDSNLLSADVTLLRPAGEDWLLGFGLTLEKAMIPDRPLADSLTRSLELSLSRRDTGLGAVTLRLGAVDVASDAAGVAWRGPSFSLGWTPPIESATIGLNLDLQAERRDYWRTTDLAPDARMALSLTAELKSLRVMGFNPTVTLSAARTKSEVVVRDTQEIGVTFGIASSF